MAYRHDPSLKDQTRRAAVAVMSNIAEGFERYSRREFRQFIARGFASEVRSQLHLARELDYVPEEEFVRLLELCLEISHMLAALRNRTSPTSGRRS